MKMCFVTVRKQSLGQGNIFTSVCHSFCPRGSLPPGESASGGGSDSSGGLHKGGGIGQTPLSRVLQDTVNKRAVRILLECILV